MSDKDCEADLEDPLVKRRPGHGIQEEEPPYGLAADACMCIGKLFLVTTIIGWIVCSIDVIYPIDPVFVSSLKASSNGTTWDTDISIHYPMDYPKDLNVKYDARASLLSENASVSATMHYSFDRHAPLLLHADFPGAKEEDDAVVAVDLLVEANVTLIYDGMEMSSYMTIECNDLKIQFRRSVGRLYGSSKYGHVRTFRNGQWYKGIEHQYLFWYLHPTVLHPTPGVPY